MKFLAALSLATLSYFATTPPDIASEACLKDAVPYSIKFPSIPVIELEKLNLNRVPWSTTVILRDSFSEEESVIVFDKNFKNPVFPLGLLEEGVITILGQRAIAAKYYVVTSEGMSYLDAVEAAIKIDNKVFLLQRVSNNQFSVTPELADALSKAEKAVVRIRLTQDRTETREISSRTLSAWKSAYALVKADCP
jgi:hypothetical protein